MCYVGSIGTVFAMMMTSLCKEFYQFLLAQGILLGVSMSLVTWPMLALVGKWVTANNRGAALGIVLAGSSLGGVIWPIAIDRLLRSPEIGFPWTMRICGFIMMPLLLFSSVVARLPPAPSTRNDNLDLARNLQGRGISSTETKNVSRKKEAMSLLRKPSLQLLCLAMFIIYFGMFSPFFYTTSYAVAKGYPTSFAFYSVSIVNGASFFGRIVPGIIADKYGKFNCCIAATLLAGITALCWTKVDSVAGLGVWSAAYGFASGVSTTLALKTCTFADRTRAFCRSSKPAPLRSRHLPPWVWRLGVCLLPLLSRMYLLNPETTCHSLMVEVQWPTFPLVEHSRNNMDTWRCRFTLGSHYYSGVGCWWLRGWYRILDYLQLFSISTIRRVQDRGPGLAHRRSTTCLLESRWPHFPWTTEGHFERSLTHGDDLAIFHIEYESPVWLSDGHSSGYIEIIQTKTQILSH